MTVVPPCTQDLMDSTHPQAVLSKLNEQRSLGLFCDVTIVVEDVKFRAHRNILAACSGYFKTALMAPESLSSSEVLELMDLKSDVFASILNFIYCSKVGLHGAVDTLSLVAAGKRLGIPFLERLTDQDRQGVGISQTAAKNLNLNNPIKDSVPKKSKKDAQGPEEMDTTRGPRITNAFSITEVGPGNNPFTPLVPTSGERQSPDMGQIPASCPATSCLTGDNESTNALSEHSYAVSQDTEHRDGSQSDNRKTPKSLQSHLKQLANRNMGPLKKRHRLRGTLGRNIPSTSPLPYSGSQTINSITSSDGTTTPAVTAPPSLISEVEKQKGAEHDSVVTTDNIQMELDPPTLSPHTEDSISIYGCEYCPEIFTNKALHTLHVEVHKKRFVSHLFCKFCHRKFMHLKRLRNHEQACPKALRESPGPDPGDTEDRAMDPQSDSAPSADNLATETRLPPEDVSAPCSPDFLETDKSEEQQTVDKTVKPGESQKAYNCSVCKRVYVTLSSLRRHENVHSWQRAYPCHYCNKVFALAEYRTKHEIWHTGERRYQCIFCLETFMTYYILKNHQKSFHGIDPRLAAKKKLANGGFKSSVYPIKLYRLLPMKFRKRRYKTYSQTYSEEVEGSDQAPLEGSSPVPSLEENSNISSPDPLSFPMPVTFMATPKTVATVTPRISFDQPCNQDIDQNLNTEINKGHQGGTGKKADHRMDSSLVDYDYTCPIQPGTDSTAMRHEDNTQAFMNSQHSGHTMAFLGKSLNTTDKLGELSAAAKRVEAMTKQILQSGAESLAPDKRLGGKTETYIAKPACPGPSVDSDTLPLCQITVKIGNEAIIRRRIKGSKLFPKKRKRSRSYSKVENPGQCTPVRDGVHHLNSQLRTDVTSLGQRDMFDDNDQDTADELWRPYYSYKPKKKSKKLKLKHRKERQYSYPPAVARSIVSEVYLDRRNSRTDESITSAGGDVKRGLRNCCPRANYTCDICDSCFITESGLRAHVIGSHPCFCRTCGKQGPPGEAPAGADYVCNSCMENGSCFDNTPRSPSIEKRYRCSFCPQRFLYLATKRSHEKKHLETTGKSFKYDDYPVRNKHSMHLSEGEDSKRMTIKMEDSDDQESSELKSSLFGRGHFSIDKTEPRAKDEDKANCMVMAPKPCQEMANCTTKFSLSPPCKNTYSPMSPSKMKHKRAKRGTNTHHSTHHTSKIQTYRLDKASYKGHLTKSRTDSYDKYEQPSSPFWKTNSETSGSLVSTYKSEKWKCKQEPVFNDHF